MNTKLRRILLRLYFFITGVGLFLVLSGTALVVSAQNPPPSTASIAVVNVQGAKVPDWNRITFENLPGINSNGGFQANAAIVQQLGYDPSRQWSQGQKPSSFVALGDFQNSFDLQNFDLSQIGQASGTDTQSAGLEKFGVMLFQDLKSLVKAVSGLGAFPIAQVPPILDLIAQSVGSFDASQTIDQLLAKAPQLGDLSFANLDLSQYSIADIPNLETTQLGAFKNWQAVKIEDIPGLQKVPWSNFPNAPQADGQTVGLVDVVFGAAEHERLRSISGSTVEGFGVPCDTEANSSKANSTNKSITTNSSQQQSTNRVTLQTSAGCTNNYETVTLDALSSAIAAVESGGDSGAVGGFTCDNKGNCGRALGDKQFMSYRDEVRSIVGSKPGGTDFLQDLDSGQAVSQEQLLQYFSPIEQQQLFNADSQRLITLASSQIDPTTGQPFAGERLIERVAQMHLGGAAVEIDSRATDINDKSVKAYGESVSENYKQATAQMGCS